MMHHRTAKEVRPVPGSTRKDCESACGHGEKVMGQKCICPSSIWRERKCQSNQSQHGLVSTLTIMSASWMPGPRVGAKSTENNELTGQQSSGKGGIPERSIFF